MTTLSVLASDGLHSPATRLDQLVMKRFHHAVRHWSRAREFAADASVAGPIGLKAAVRALLRVAAVQPCIDAALQATADDPGAECPDLVTAVLDWLCVQGPADPAGLAAGKARFAALITFGVRAVLAL